MKGNAFIKRYRWIFVFAVVIALGYTLGKDLAFKHNAEDRAAATAAKL